MKSGEGVLLSQLYRIYWPIKTPANLTLTKMLVYDYLLQSVCKVSDSAPYMVDIKDIAIHIKYLI